MMPLLLMMDYAALTYTLAATPGHADTRAALRLPRVAYVAAIVYAMSLRCFRRCRHAFFRLRCRHAIFHYAMPADA